MDQRKISKEQLLAHARQFMRPGGGLSARNWRQIAIAFAGVLLFLGAFSSFYTVQPEEQAVVKRFGRVFAISDPGLHLKLPFGIDAVQLVATERVLKEEFGFRTESTSATAASRFASGQLPDESLMLTGDLNIIQVEWVVQYRIGDPVKYLYSMREPLRTLRDLAESVMRRVVGNRIGSDVLTIGRVDIATPLEKKFRARWTITTMASGSLRWSFRTSCHPRVCSPHLTKSTRRARNWNA